MQGRANLSAPTVVAPSPGNPRFPLLDGLRAIAALMVVALHTCVYMNYFPGWRGAFVRQLGCGVTVFFLLTGFLLYRPFVAARLSGARSVQMRDYARRRLLRIVPAYWLALTVLAVWPGLPGTPLGHDWWRYYGFVQDFDGRTLFDGLGTAWSLGTEVTFYLLLPCYALLLGRLTRRHRVRGVVATELTGLAGLSALSLAFRAAAWSKHPNLCYTLIGTFDWFAIGMAVAVLSAAADYDARLRRATQIVTCHPTITWALAAVALTAGAAYWHATGRYDPYSAGPLHLIWAGVALFVMLPAVFGRSERGLPGRVLSTRLLAWLGLVSYGIYLWHLPLVPKLGHLSSNVVGERVGGSAQTIALFLVVVAVTVICAAGSYYLMERPILRFKEGFTRRHLTRWSARVALDEQ